MRPNIWLPIITILLTLSSAIPADDESTGDITGWVDGEPSTWIVQRDVARSSAVFSTLSPGLHQFRIHAYANERFSREESLYIELVVRDGEISSAQIHYFAFPPRYPRFSFGPDHGTGQLTLHSLNVQPGQAHLSASYAGQLFYHQSPNTQPIPHRTRPMRININLTAVRD